MTRQQRAALLQELGERRGSDVLVYYLANRPGYATRMNLDALPVLYEHLLVLSRRADRRDKLDLLMHTQGGNAEVPWPLVNMCRELYPEFAVVLPGPCFSAGTMVALGADEVVMSPYANLGPVDPTLRLTLATVTGSTLQLRM